MDRIDAMTLVLTAVEQGSLAAAARRHGRSPATVTRAVARLEAFAGETLLLRSTRHLRLTAAGNRHVAIWRDVLQQLGEINATMAGGPLQGGIVLTAPQLFGRLKVMPVLESFLCEHPAISARAVFVNRLVDLLGEGVDVAVRLAPLPDSTMTAIKLGETRILVCASPDYLERAGVPTKPKALSGHECIGLNAEGDGDLWRFGSSTEKGARVRSVRVSTRLSVNDAGSAIAAALRGQGLVQARAYQVVEDVAAGRLVVVLEGYEPPPMPVHLIFHPDRGRRAPVRAFIDHSVPELRAELRRIASLLEA